MTIIEKNLKKDYFYFNENLVDRLSKREENS